MLGDPTEAALIVAAEKLGLGTRCLVEAFPRVDEFPFDSLRKRMTTVHRQPSGYLVSARALRSSSCTRCRSRPKPALVEAALDEGT